MARVVGILKHTSYFPDQCIRKVDWMEGSVEPLTGWAAFSLCKNCCQTLLGPITSKYHTKHICRHWGKFSWTCQLSSEAEESKYAGAFSWTKSGYISLSPVLLQVQGFITMMNSSRSIKKNSMWPNFPERKWVFKVYHALYCTRQAAAQIIFRLLSLGCSVTSQTNYSILQINMFQRLITSSVGHVQIYSNIPALALPLQTNT